LAEQAKHFKRGEELTIGAHLHGTRFEPDGGTVKHGCQIVADQVYITQKQGGSLVSVKLEPSRGLPLRVIKRDYLRWVLENCDNLQPSLVRAIRSVLEPTAKEARA